MAAVLRFTGLAWGAPYFHFHIDEHYVFAGADMLRRSLREASISGKFFMYGPLPMWMLNALRAVHDSLFGPLRLVAQGELGQAYRIGHADAAMAEVASRPVKQLLCRVPCR